MTSSPHKSETIYQKNYRDRTVEDYLDTIDPEILQSFHPHQVQAIKQVLEAAIPKPSPKIVDLRFGVDLVISRFYVVLFVGKDRRRKRRNFIPEKVSRVGNAIATIFLLIGLNLLISALLFLSLYLVKSALGVDFFPNDHLGDKLRGI